MKKFDLIVIGSGPAGFAAAMKAYDYGKDVLLIEKKHLGGVGIMNGALTSKTMWELSKDFAVAASVDRGYRASGLTVDFSQVKKTVIRAAKFKQYQMYSQIETFSEERSEKGRLTLKYGTGRFVDKTTVSVENEETTEYVQGKNFIIATGSRPRQLPGIKIDQKSIIDSDGVLGLHEFPERMMIIGSGIIGCEYATIFSNFRQTEVHLIDRQHRVIPYEDDDVSDFVSRSLEANGVIVHHTANLRTIRRDGPYLQVILDYNNGNSRVIEVDVVLISVGREPNTDNLGLENVDITPMPNKTLDINNVCMLENNPNKCHIFAAGDIIGKGQLYNIAEHQGRYAVDGIYKNREYHPDYSYMPTLMFFTPELASVGMNEEQLRAKGIPYRVCWYSNKLVSRTIAMRNTDGFVKIMVSHDGEDKILGMRAAGPQASAFIVSVAHLINQGNSIREVTKVLHPHPSVTEGIQEAMRLFLNESIYKKDAFPDFIRFDEWTPQTGN